MKALKENIFSKGKKINPNYFTGPIIAREISKVKIPEHKIYHVTFKKGTTTKLHHHQGGQTLIVTKGKGFLTYYQKTKGNSKFKIKKIKNIPLKIGDIAYIPAKVIHIHGSSDKRQDFSHIAINPFPTKNQEPKTTWFESDFKSKVSEILR